MSERGCYSMDFIILECRRFIAPCNNSPSKRIVCNHEFDFYLKGNRQMFIDGRMSRITDNSISFRRPGQIVSSIGDYDCYILTVDFSKTATADNYLRHTAREIEPEFKHILTDSIPDVFSPPHSSDIIALLASLSMQPELNSVASHSLFREFLYLVNADIAHREFFRSQNRKTVADTAMEYIRENFNKDIQLQDIADHACVDKSYLVRIFKKQYSLTPVSYLIEYRLSYACNLLINTNLSVNEIADMSGYNSTSFFITQFKKNLGVTPLQYKEKIQ